MNTVRTRPWHAVPVVARWFVTLLAVACSSGCLEVDQHPVWRDGAYQGKQDNLTPQRLFHGDRLAWLSTVANRTALQDEYRRTGRPAPTPAPPRATTPPMPPVPGTAPGAPS